jgi:predicted nicotinamide N-methyase
VSARLAPNLARELPQELAQLDDQFVLDVREVVIGTRTWRLERPRSVDDLISEADFARDERLPYWADLWPSAVELAAAVSARDGAGCRALELGCGLGLPALCAADAGYDVTATDYYGDALRFARRNALRNLGCDMATRLVDWRAFPGDLRGFDLVLASDVLYERAYAPLVARAVVQSLAPGGVALVADPGRAAIEGFRLACVGLGASVSAHRKARGTAEHQITIHEVRLG